MSAQKGKGLYCLSAESFSLFARIASVDFLTVLVQRFQQMSRARRVLPRDGLPSNQRGSQRHLLNVDLLADEGRPL